MAAYSQAVKALGIFKCELCGDYGDERNPLTRHHCDGDHHNNDPSNFLVVHRWRCHTWADWLTQEFIHRGQTATAKDIVWAYGLITTNGWLITLVQERRRK